jgi:hypothetical protein
LVVVLQLLRNGIVFFVSVAVILKLLVTNTVILCKQFAVTVLFPKSVGNVDSFPFGEC